MEKRRFYREEKHPHVRGEDDDALFFIGDVVETPPRAWGRPVRRLRDDFNIRNTPTCVGKTPSLLKAVGKGTKHPHVRGEDGSPSSCG